MKICTICKLEKSIDEFNKHSKRKDGKQPHCRDCNRERSRRYYAENTELHKKNVILKTQRYRQESRERLAEYLLLHPCVDCGFSDIRALEFDHVRGKKEKNISHAVAQGWSWERVLSEIAKCEVRCSNCHRIKTCTDFKWYKGLKHCGDALDF